MNVSRRGFFAAIAAAGEVPRMTMRTAKNGERVSLLGYGCMRLPTVDGGHANPWGDNASKEAIDQKSVNELVDYMLEHGVNYFDTSPRYCRGESEEVMGKALARHPRSSYYMATKLSNFDEQNFPAEKCRAMFERSLKLLQTDYIDFYLLHSVGNGGFATFKKRYIDNGIIDWLLEQKKTGRIRNLGWSFHGDEKCVDWLLEQHDKGRYVWDFAQIQLNYVDWRHAKQVNDRNVDAEKLYRELAERDIPVVVMEPLLGGRLAQHNDAVFAELSPVDANARPANWALRFAGSFPKVLTVLSGMTYKEHVVENVATYSPLKPLTDRERVALERAAQAYLGCGAIPCNRCNYCMPCPYGIDIPGLLTCISQIRVNHIVDPMEIRAAFKKAVPDVRRQADRCIGCGRCVVHCPQNIDIPKVLDAIAEFLEGLS